MEKALKPSFSAKRIGLILLDGFPLMSAATMAEAFRAANELAETPRYSFTTMSQEGGLVRSSCGVCFDTEPFSDRQQRFDLVFLLTAGNPFDLENATLAAYLRRLNAHGVKLGGVSGGGVFLAKIGLMKDRRFTVHWHHYTPLRVLDDQLLLAKNLYVIDRDRFTCAGGIAVLDMLNVMFSTDHGTHFGRLLGDWFNLGHIREGQTPLRLELGHEANFKDKTVAEAVKLMESHIAEPLSLEALADLCGTSERQLTRVFRREVNASAMMFYRDLRLSKARNLIEQSAATIGEIAIATGFQNPSHFARLFKKRYEVTPLALRLGDES